MTKLARPESQLSGLVYGLWIWRFHLSKVTTSLQLLSVLSNFFKLILKSQLLHLLPERRRRKMRRRREVKIIFPFRVTVWLLCGIVCWTRWATCLIREVLMFLAYLSPHWRSKVAEIILLSSILSIYLEWAFINTKSQEIVLLLLEFFVSCWMLSVVGSW